MGKLKRSRKRISPPFGISSRRDVEDTESDYNSMDFGNCDVNSILSKVKIDEGA